MSRILVTGGAGFIGSHLIDRLIREGHVVTCFDNLSTGKNIKGIGKIFRKVDIRNFDEIEMASHSCAFDYIFHLAAQINLRNSILDPHNDATNNILGTLNIIQLAARHGAKIIFSSTGGAIYNPKATLPWNEDTPTVPESPYGISKLAAEHYLRTGAPDSVIFRLANVYGPRQNPHGEAGVIAIFLDKMLNGLPIQVFGTGLQTRDFVYVDDVINALVLGMNESMKGIFNVSTGKMTSVNLIIQSLSKIIGIQNLVVENRPAIVGELKHSVLNYDKIKGRGWRPLTQLSEGLNKTVAYYL